MTYLFSDGLDGQGDLPDRWAIRQPEATLSAGTGKFSGGSLAFTGIAGAGAALVTGSFPSPTAARGSTTNPAHFSFYMKSATAPSINRAIAVLRDEQNGSYLTMVAGTNGGITCAQLSTIVATSSLVTAPQGNVYDNLWHHIECKVIISATVGLIQVWIDNVKVVDFSGDTINVGSLGAEGFSAFSVDSANTATNMDDIFVWDEEGTDFAVTGQFGAHRIATIIPNGAGNSTQFTVTGAASNYLAVDEAIADDDTTYVESGTVGNKDLYAYTSMPTGVDTIHGVAVHTRSKNDDIGLINAAIVARSNAVEADGTTFSVSSAGIYNNNTTFFPTDPSGGALWTETRVNAAEFGIKVVA